jgi:hypothetical protein
VKVAPTKVKNPVNAVKRQSFSNVAMMLPPTNVCSCGRLKRPILYHTMFALSFSPELFWAAAILVRQSSSAPAAVNFT